MSLRGLMRSGVSRLGEIDSTGAVVTIDLPHAEVHEGESFVASVYDTALSTYTVLFTTPNADVEAHLTIEYSTDQRVTCVIYRAPDATGGTALSIINRDHNSLNTPDCIVTHTPTVTAAGSDIVDRYMVGSGEKSGGMSRNDQEHILRKNTKYLIVFTGTNFILNARILWYEED
jgi:hypothetical protein